MSSLTSPELRSESFRHANLAKARASNRSAMASMCCTRNAFPLTNSAPSLITSVCNFHKLRKQPVQHRRRNGKKWRQASGNVIIKLRLRMKINNRIVWDGQMGTKSLQSKAHGWHTQQFWEAICSWTLTNSEKSLGAWRQQALKFHGKRCRDSSKAV